MTSVHLRGENFIGLCELGNSGDKIIVGLGEFCIGCYQFIQFVLISTVGQQLMHQSTY